MKGMRNYPAIPKELKDSQFAKDLQTVFEASIEEHQKSITTGDMDYTNGRLEGRSQLLKELLYDVLGIEYKNKEGQTT